MEWSGRLRVESLENPLTERTEYLLLLSDTAPDELLLSVIMELMETKCGGTIKVTTMKSNRVISWKGDNKC